MKELKEISELKRFLWLFKDLQKISRQLSRLAVIDCNIGLTESQEKREGKLLKKADKTAREFNLRAYNQGDPRGIILYLVEEEEFKKGSNCDYTNGIPVY